MSVTTNRVQVSRTSTPGNVGTRVKFPVDRPIAIRGWWPTAVSLCLATGVVFFGVTPLVGLAAVILVSWGALRFPRIAIASLSLLVLVPQVLQTASLLPDGWDVLGAGVRASDLVLVGMCAAAAWRILARRWHTSLVRKFITASVVLGMVMVAQVIRNVETYGLSAPGELRFRYLVLGLPVYLGLTLESEDQRDWVAKWMTWAPLVATILATPLVASTVGVALDPNRRFFPASISLALLMAAISIHISRTSNPRGPSLHTWATFLFIAVVLVKDLHRSVWMVAAILTFLLAKRGYVPRRYFVGLAVAGVTIFVLASLAWSTLWSDLVAYIGSRTRAFADPLGDPTSRWRLMVWKAYLDRVLAQPCFGEGFGGYWDAYVPELGGQVSVFPHSLYVMTLVKTGVVGLGTVVAWFLNSIRLLKSECRHRFHRDSGIALMTMGLLGAVGSLTYGIAYGLDYWLLAWLGLGLAEAAHRASEHMVS